MPAKYARYFIEILDVRCEQLQDISDKDCLREGIVKGGHPLAGGVPAWYVLDRCFENSPQEAYSALIDEINGKKVWESNPYVWVYDFIIRY